MESKVFQFNPDDYSTNYETVRSIHYPNPVVKIGNRVAIEYISENQLISLFAKIQNTLPVIPETPVSHQSKWNIPLTIIAVPFLIWFIIWLFS